MRSIPYSEIEAHGDYEGRFIRTRVSDGATWELKRGFLSRAHFLEALAKWNRMQPDIWRYSEYVA